MENLIGCFHIVIAMKPIEGTFAENALKYGVAGINIDECRVGYASDADKELYHKNGLGPIERFKTSKRVYDGGKQSAGFSDTHSSVGRFPANVILEDSEEILMAFPENRQGFSGGGVRKKKSDIMPSIQVKEDGEASQMYGDNGSAARFFKQIDKYEEKQ